MSRTSLTIALLLLSAGCGLFGDDKEEKEESEEPTLESTPASRWVDDISPLMEDDRDLDNAIFQLAFQINCGQGPASVDPREKVQQQCAVTNPDGGPVPAQTVAQVLKEELIPQADQLARALTEIEVDGEEIPQFHKELTDLWNDRVDEYMAILDAWEAEDRQALNTALDVRLRNRRAAGDWRFQTNQVLAEEGLLLGP